MADFEVEVGFTIEGFSGNVDLLERYGVHLEEIAPEMGPAVAIRGEHYVALLTVDADSTVEAARRGAESVIEAIKNAMEEFGDEVDTSDLERKLDLHAGAAEPALA